MFGPFHFDEFYNIKPPKTMARNNNHLMLKMTSKKRYNEHD